MFQNREGQRVPQVVFHIRHDNAWEKISTNDLFAHKAVVVFSLPGAYTPTCSSSHLPRYEELADALKANGVDDIYCLSVNDTFVMNEWAMDQGIEQVKLIPDGNGEFTRGMGMLVDKEELGFGKRSWRYSMLVKDGVIEKMFIEPDKAGDPFEVSDADTMLNYINPKAHKPDQIAVLSKEGCPFCVKAKELLKQKGFDYVDITLPHKTRSRATGAITGAQTTPQVFINGRLIGGLEQLQRHLGVAA